MEILWGGEEGRVAVDGILTKSSTVKKEFRIFMTEQDKFLGLGL